MGTPRFAFPQERGANALGEAVETLGATTRVLMIGAHPDDEDTFLISWLSRGRHVEIAYLSLTRGDGGQNLIGNELGEALGVIRTEELLAARRVDGAGQYFTRAFDFGFSKDTIDTYKHWVRDSILGDVVRVVRAFRPQVIIAVFSGTPRDGHGHHQVSGLLAREAYRVAGDTVRFPTKSFGPPWTPLKLYGNARYDPTGGETMRIDVGEYSPLLGRSYAEIAGESRSQHKSQGFGTPQRKGPFLDALRREFTRVNESTPARDEKSIFDGIDTTWNRFRAGASRQQLGGLDSLPAAIAVAKASFDPMHPRRLLAPLAHLRQVAVVAVTGSQNLDLVDAVQRLFADVKRALQLATGVEMEAIAPREVYALNSTAPIVVSTYNRGTDTLFVGRPEICCGIDPPREPSRPLAPASVIIDTIGIIVTQVTQPSWLIRPRVGAMFAPVFGGNEAMRPGNVAVLRVALKRPSAELSLSTPVVWRGVDPVKGEIRREIAGAPAISVTLDTRIQYAPANTEFQRDLAVHLRSVDDAPRDVRVRLTLPAGLTADSVERSARLDRYDATQTLTFRLRGRLPAGEHRIAVTAQSQGETFTDGYQLVDYDHIRRQRIYRPATTTLSVVDMKVPATLRVAYITGVGDNVAPMLAQLGIPVTVIPASEVARTDLTPYTTVVVGPRAYEAHPQLVAANAQLFDFARNGGTVVVQYGQNEMTQAGAMPYPITLVRPADRVTDENAPVRIETPNDKVLTTPNRIGPQDFTGWVQERALYMPRTFDPHYRSLLSMNDPGEPPNGGAILVAPLGQGQYIYTTLSLFRQLPAGVPGGARLFLNILSAGLVTSAATP
ncbi:MAG TPA: PIG-L family deacetylase [Gemmatimonadaceae bacterium]|nr:PIG-L family deacetylase [Gemmatimonadaceae bacterium]